MPAPSTTDPRHTAARRHLQDGAPQAALPILEALLEDNSNDPYLLNDAALAHVQDGNTAQAERYLRRALEAQPDHETSFYNLLDLLLEKKNDLAASQIFEQHAATIPGSEQKDHYAERLTPSQPSEEVIVRCDDSSPKNHLIVVTQPRSGSTIFWQTFRRDSQLTCYNEPFNPHLRHHFETNQDYYNTKSETHSEVFKEFLALPDLMQAHWSTIQSVEEIYPTLIGHQIEYIQALLNTREHVCIDFIRCSAKVDHLRSAFPDALIVHLVRDPRSWTTSHLRPYGEWLPGLPENFFCHDGWFNYWSRQKLAQHLNLDGYAHEQLLQVWNCLTLATEQSEPDITVQFEHFTQAPQDVLRIIYQFLDLPYVPIDTTDIHPPNRPYSHHAPAWSKAIQQYLSVQTRRFVYNFPQQVSSGTTSLSPQSHA